MMCFKFQQDLRDDRTPQKPSLVPIWCGENFARGKFMQVSRGIRGKMKNGSSQVHDMARVREQV